MATSVNLSAWQANLEQREETLVERAAEVSRREGELTDIIEQWEGQMDEKKQEIEEIEEELEQKRALLSEREARLVAKIKEVDEFKEVLDAGEHALSSMNSVTLMENVHHRPFGNTTDTTVMADTSYGYRNLHELPIAPQYPLATPQYTPASRMDTTASQAAQAYSSFSPMYLATESQYPANPTYSPTSPHHSRTGRTYSPPSPAYSGIRQDDKDSSWSPFSADSQYNGRSQPYSPGSPHYSPNGPRDDLFRQAVSAQMIPFQPVYTGSAAEVGDHNPAYSTGYPPFEAAVAYDSTSSKYSSPRPVYPSTSPNPDQAILSVGQPSLTDISAHDGAQTGLYSSRSPVYVNGTPLYHDHDPPSAKSSPTPGDADAPSYFSQAMTEGIGMAASRTRSNSIPPNGNTSRQELLRVRGLGDQSGMMWELTDEGAREVGDG